MAGISGTERSKKALITLNLSSGLAIERGMEPPFPPLPGVHNDRFPGIVTFTREEVGTQAQLDPSIQRLFMDGAPRSIPLWGPFCYMGTSPLAEQMLFMLSRRSSIPCRLLVSLPADAGKGVSSIPSAVRQSRILGAAKDIDDASGLSLKVGPTGRYQEFQVDQHGRPAASGSTLYSFTLQLRRQDVLSSQLVQDSLKLVTTTGKSLLPTDPLIVHQWPSINGVRRLLLPAMESDVSLHLLYSKQAVPAATAEVAAAMQILGVEARRDLAIYRDTQEGVDVVVLFTLNAALVSFLLMTCPNFGSAGTSDCRPEISLIRHMVLDPVPTSGLSLDVEMQSDESSGTASQSQNTWAKRLTWTRPLSNNKDLLPRVTRGVHPRAEDLLPEHLLNRLHGGAVYQRAYDLVGPSVVVSFPHFCMNFDYDRIKGEIAALLVEHISTVHDGHPHDLSYARWESEIGALYTWTPMGRRLCRILVRVQPGTTFALVIDALNGRCLSWDPDQPLFPQLTLCVCRGCQQHLLDTTGYGCVECTAKDHFVGATDCPRLQARRAQAQRKREQAARDKSTAASVHSSIPIAEPVVRSTEVQHGALPTLKEGDETEESDSEAERAPSSTDQAPQSTHRSPSQSNETLDASTLYASSLLAAADELSVALAPWRWTNDG